MTIPLQLSRDNSGAVTPIRVQSEDIYGVLLSAGVPVSFTLPTTSSQWKVIFGYEVGASVFVATKGNTAAYTSSATFAKVTSEPNPTGLLVNGGDTISVVTNSTTARVYISLYQNGGV